MNAEPLSAVRSRVARTALSCSLIFLVACATQVSRGPDVEKVMRPEAARMMREQPPPPPVAHEGAAVPAPASAPQRSALVKVHFGTNRKRNAKSLDSQATPFFNCQNAGRLTYGTLNVTVDANHPVGDIKKSVHLYEPPAILQEREFLKQLREDLARQSGRQLLVFVHGYNVTFENAAKRTAQIKHDLPFDGEAAFFSWPSRGKLLGYWADEKSVCEAEPYLEEFLVKLARESHARSIYIIAHSMGNRAFTAVYPRVRAALPGNTSIKEIMLAAPDIDAGVFRREIAPQLMGAGCNTTLYSSGRDKALWGSFLMHGFTKRAGQQVIGLFGLENVDASSTDTSKLGLGHSYYAEQIGLLTDLRDLIKGRRPPQRTATLEEHRQQRTAWLLKRVPTASKP